MNEEDNRIIEGKRQKGDRIEREKDERAQRSEGRVRIYMCDKER